MNEDFGSDYITISDEDGNEFELELLDTLEFEGKTYSVLVPADIDTMDVNIPMRSLLEKSGFVYTGVIELEDHRGLRVAYQYLQKAGV